MDVGQFPAYAGLFFLCGGGGGLVAEKCKVPNILHEALVSDRTQEELQGVTGGSGGFGCGSVVGQRSSS